MTAVLLSDQLASKYLEFGDHDLKFSATFPKFLRLKTVYIRVVHLGRDGYFNLYSGPVMSMIWKWGEKVFRDGEEEWEVAEYPSIRIEVLNREFFHSPIIIPVIRD